MKRPGNRVVACTSLHDWAKKERQISNLLCQIFQGTAIKHDAIWNDVRFVTHVGQVTRGNTCSYTFLLYQITATDRRADGPTIPLTVVGP